MYRDIILKENQAFNAVFDNVVSDDLHAYRVIYQLNNPINGTLKVSVKRADGETITDTAPVIDGVGKYVLKNNMYSKQGLSLMRVAVADEMGSIVTPHEVSLTVLEPFGEADAEGDDRVPALSSLIVQATQAAGSANAALEAANEALDRAEGLGGGTIDTIFAMAGSNAKADIYLEQSTAAQQIMDEVARLDDERVSDETPIHIAFTGDKITLAYGTGIDLTGHDNLYIHGNGVKIEGKFGYNYLLYVVGCWLHDIIVENAGEYRYGINASNSTLSNCEGIGGDYGKGINASNSTLSNCTGNSEYYGIFATNSSTLSNCTGSGYYGITADNSTLTNCTGTGGDFGIYLTSSSILVGGCEGTGGTYNIFIEASAYPQDLTIAENLNRGEITIEGVNN